MCRANLVAVMPRPAASPKTMARGKPKASAAKAKATAVKSKAKSQPKRQTPVRLRNKKSPDKVGNSVERLLVKSVSDPDSTCAGQGQALQLAQPDASLETAVKKPKLEGCQPVPEAEGEQHKPADAALQLKDCDAMSRDEQACDSNPGVAEIEQATCLTTSGNTETDGVPDKHPARKTDEVGQDC